MGLVGETGGGGREWVNNWRVMRTVMGKSAVGVRGGDD